MLQCGLDNFKNYLFCAHTGRCRCVLMYNECLIQYVKH